MSGFFEALQARFGERARAGVPLAPLTTFRVGGPAEWYVDTRSSDDVRDALRLARDWGVPLTMLGGGSNVLVSDAGVRGLVVHPRGGGISLSPGVGRRPARSAGAGEHDEVRADAAVTINGLVRWTISRGLAGLEAWAGTPGTVGGGIWGNAHFQGRLLGEHVTRVCVLTPSGDESIVDAADMGFAYDRSRLQGSGEIVLWAEFRVGCGQPDALRAAARESLAFRKRTQPLHMASAGCIFQNPSEDDPVPSGIPRSAGALIDRAGLKGAASGAARVSEVHANFIVNAGGATAADIRSLIERCRTAVACSFGVILRDEIVCLGTFDPDGPAAPPPSGDV